MDAEDASAAEMRGLFADPQADPLALDEEAVERLLAGDLPPAQAPPAYAEVAALLAATAAAPTPQELAGRWEVLAELRALTRARRGAPGLGRGRPARRGRVGLAAVVLVGALATSGAAAAATGHLPGPVRSILGTVGGRAEPDTVTQPGRQPVAPSPASAGRQGPTPTGAAGPGPGATAAGPATGPGGRGLCQAFMAGRGADRGTKLDAAAFRALAELAGGADKILTYCRDSHSGRAGSHGSGQGQQAQPGNQGRGQGSGPPANTATGNPGLGWDGPPPSGDGGSQGLDGPPGARSHGD